MTQTRFDAARFSKTKITDEGYLETEAIVTRSGVFFYKNQDGSIRRELRHPDDIFKQDSLSSLKMIPITDGHPESKLVNAKSAKTLQIGNVGESIKVDGKFLKAPLVITDENAIAKVRNGKNQLSLGYTADVINEPGTYNGQRYDCRQTNIRYNHLATCALARAGADASIKLDAGDAIQMDDDFVEDSDNQSFNNKTRGDNPMEKINLDGISYEASAEVINAYNKISTRVDELLADAESKKGIFDALEAEKTRLEEKVEAFDKTFNDSVNAAVKERVALIAASTNILDKDVKLDDMSNLDIKTAVIKAISKEANLDEKTEDYINARFDAALEMNAERADLSDQRKTVGATAGTSDSGKSILTDSRDRYLKRLEGLEGDKK